MHILFLSSFTNLSHCVVWTECCVCHRWCPVLSSQQPWIPTISTNKPWVNVTVIHTCAGAYLTETLMHVVVLFALLFWHWKQSTNEATIMTMVHGSRCSRGRLQGSEKSGISHSVFLLTKLILHDWEGGLMNYKDFCSDWFIFGAINTPERKRGYFATSVLVQKYSGICSSFYASIFSRKRKSIK